MKKANNKAQIIEQDMCECFEQLGFPNLGIQDSITLPDGGGTKRIFMFGLRSRYMEDYYSRAMVDMVIEEKVSADKIGPLRELINRINTDLVCDHFCIIPEVDTLVFRTSLYVPGDRLPRDKFKKLLTQFFADLTRYLLPIEKLLVEVGNPEEIFQSLGADGSATPKERTLPGGTDYEKLLHGIKRVLAKAHLPVERETITESSVYVTSSFRFNMCRIAFLAGTLNDTGQLYLQMACPDKLPENMISEAVEMANLFNSTSYANHFFILPGHNIISFLAGVMHDPVLDEDELEYQLKILLAMGRTCFPVFLGHHPANTSPTESLKEFIYGCCAKVKS